MLICLHNLFLFNMKGMTPEKHILRNWVKRSKTFGNQNVGKEHLSGATAQTLSAAWDNGASIAIWKANDTIMRGPERPTACQRERLLVTLSLGEVLLTEEKCIAVTHHSSVQQMRQDYGLSHEWTHDCLVVWAASPMESATADGASFCCTNASLLSACTELMSWGT